jgi:hypothetical protein
MTEELHEALGEIAFLIGTWRGEGKGRYPTIDPFAYGEEVTFAAPPRKPVLAYSQRTWHLEKGFGMHSETGYWRAVAPGRVEIIIAHPFGVAEIAEGGVENKTVDVLSTVLVKTTTAKEVEQTHRIFTLVGDDVLRYEVRMAAVGQPLQEHLEAELRRV